MQHLRKLPHRPYAPNPTQTPPNPILNLLIRRTTTNKITKCHHIQTATSNKQSTFNWSRKSKEDKKIYELKTDIVKKRYELEMEVFRQIGGKLEIEKKIEKQTVIEKIDGDKEKRVKFDTHGEGLFGGDSADMVTFVSNNTDDDFEFLDQ